MTAEKIKKLSDAIAKDLGILVDEEVQKSTPTPSAPFITLTHDEHGTGIYVSLFEEGEGFDEDKFATIIPWENLQEAAIGMNKDVLNYFIPKIEALLAQMKSEQ